MGDPARSHAGHTGAHEGFGPCPEEPAASGVVPPQRVPEDGAGSAVDGLSADGRLRAELPGSFPAGDPEGGDYCGGPTGEELEGH